MKTTLTLLLLFFAGQLHSAMANELVNPGFENGWQGWVPIDPKKNALKISKKSHSGIGAAEINSTDGYFVQSVKVQKNTNYELNAKVLGAGILGAKVNKSLFVERTPKGKKWKDLTVTFNTTTDDEITIFAQFDGGRKAYFDDFSLVAIGGPAKASSSAIQLGDAGLSPDLPPGKNFELIDWYLSVPDDRNRDGKADRILEHELSSGYSHEEFFYTGKDGGLVFRAPVDGATTSAGNQYTRSELREMLRRGNTGINVQTDGLITTKNNWVLSTAPRFAQQAAGGIDGALIATLEVNKVTTTGSQSGLGLVAIGQIGAISNAPIRLYYQKFPYHEKGSLFVKHETLDGLGQEYFDILGSHKQGTEEPSNGIKLNERFTFEIIASGHAATVAIIQDGKRLGGVKVYLTKGGYDSKETYLYFRVGINNRNATADKNEYVQATYYQIENTHVGYDF